MAETRALLANLDKRSPAEVALEVAWHVHPLRSRVSLPENSYALLVFFNGSRSYVRQDPMFSMSYKLDYGNPDVRNRLVRAEVYEHLHVLVQERYAHRIIVFPGGAEEAELRHLLRDMTGVELPIAKTREEQAEYTERFREAGRMDKDAFMTHIKEELRRLVDRNISPQFLELSQQLTDVRAQIAESTKEIPSISKKIDELLRRNPEPPVR